MRKVILASASPRRQDLLARIVYPYSIVPADIDETPLPHESPTDYVHRLARRKALVVSADYPAHAVLGADTIVVLDGELLGKPTDPQDALRMLDRLSGREHEVHTGVAWALNAQVRRSGHFTSRVHLRRGTEKELADYVASGEPLDKAGSYAIQGDAGSLVTRVEGSVTNVIGLPLEQTEEMARAIGLEAPAGQLPPDAVERRFRAVSGEIQATAVAHGRAIDDVGLITVVKGLPVELAQAAVRAGARDLGENYVQEAAGKRAAIGPGPRWHLIGPLQSNKAKLAAAHFDLVHTVSSAKTAKALARHTDTISRILLQVNVSGDPNKAGLEIEEVGGLAESLCQESGIAIEGLMTIGRADVSAEATRSCFAGLRECLADLRARELVRGDTLSMGMSGDYGLAIAEGATLVRLGTAILGNRPPREGA